MRVVVFFAVDAFFAGAALAAVDRDAFGFVVFAAVVDDFAVVDFAAVLVDFFVVDFVVVALRDDDRFLSSPIGSTLPTALTAPLATSPTVPATFPAVFPAVRPTCFMILAGSGIGRSPFVRRLARRSSERDCTLRARRRGRFAADAIW